MTRATTKAPQASETFALTLLQDKLYSILLESGPKKTGELVAAVDHPAVTLHLTKHALKSSERFTFTQRKWDIAARWEPPQIPFAEIVRGLMKGTGRPVTPAQMAPALAHIFERETESMETLVRKFVENSKEFAQVGDGFIPTDWLLDVQYESAEDTAFYNYVDLQQVKSLQKEAGSLDWENDAPGASVQLALEHKGDPIQLKSLFYLAWEVQRDALDTAPIYEALCEDAELGISSDQRVYRISDENNWLDGLKAVAESITADDLDDEEEAEDEPPTITDTDIDDIAGQIAGKDVTSHLADIILQVFEIEPGEKVYEPTESTLIDRLKHKPELQWVGGGRFRPAGSIPEEYTRIPEGLLIPEYDFVNIEGERFDIEMEPAGLESGLSKEVHELLVRDVGDEDTSERPVKRPTMATCVLKYHHKIAGTFPLAQMPGGFFEAAPAIQEITFQQDSSKWTVWVNLETRLIYGLADMYNSFDCPISGGVFHLHATGRPDVFNVEHTGETDETAFVNQGRLLELLQLKEEADNERLPTFEVACRLLERQNHGLSYARLFIELNLIRRVGRMLVASLLSGYHCFSRQAKTGLWVFDSKKKELGFIRSKRKYVVKES